MIVSEIDLFEALSQQLGAEQAKSVVRYVEAKVDKRIEDRQSEFVLEKDKEKLLTKADAPLTGADVISVPLSSDARN